MKMTSNGSWPQNIESGISQQQLGRSYPNLKLELGWPNQTLQILQMNRTLNRRWPQNIKSEISQ